MYKEQIYEEETFKAKHKTAYNQTLKEAKNKGIDLEHYYFSQYLTVDVNSEETSGMATYILDDGTDDITFHAEFLFNRNGKIIHAYSGKEED